MQDHPLQMQPGQYTIRITGYDGGLRFEVLPIQLKLTAAAESPASQG